MPSSIHSCHLFINVHWGQFTTKLVCLNMRERGREREREEREEGEGGEEGEERQTDRQTDRQIARQRENYDLIICSEYWQQVQGIYSEICHR